MIRSLYRESERIIHINYKTVVEKLSIGLASVERRYRNKNRQYNQLCKRLCDTFEEDWESELN